VSTSSRTGSEVPIWEREATCLLIHCSAIMQAGQRKAITTTVKIMAVNIH
jgi:hypothetical protein